jgi:hypothetical protein
MMDQVRQKGFDQDFVGVGRMSGGDAEQRAEGGMPGAAPVEADDEFVEVALDVFAASRDRRRAPSV